MSRIGRKPIPVPDTVTVTIEPELVRVHGPRGEHRALHGLTRSLVANMVEGVTTGFEKRLEIQGVGYRAALRGKDIELQVGYSHPVQIKAPDGIEFEVPVPTQIVVRGNSKQVVGEMAAQTGLALGDDGHARLPTLRVTCSPR